MADRESMDPFDLPGGGGELDDDDTGGPLTLDVELPTKVAFKGTSMDDIDGDQLKIGDRVRVMVTGSVTGIHDTQMRDHLRHSVTVQVQSVVKVEDE
jgi:hypothetical protein